MSAGEEDRVEPPGPDAEPPNTDNATDTSAASGISDAEVVDAEVVTLLDPAAQALADAHAKVAATQASLDQAQARLRAVSKAYTELQSENKAFKERMEHRAKLDSELQAFEQVRVFFDPVMNLARCLAAPGDGAGLRDGIVMVQTQFMDALRRLGLAEVPGVGARFDPNVHEALGVAPVTDRAQDGIVLVVHTVGYSVKGRVLQAAQVVIGKAEEAAGEA